MSADSEVRCGCKGCALARREGAADATRLIRELHKPIPHPYQDDVELCSHCGSETDGSWIYPCPTIKALDGGQ